MAADIPTVAEARADDAGAVVGKFLRAAIVENKGGAGGVAHKPCQGGGAFVAEFSIARIDCSAAFEDFAAAQGATGRPREREADRERDRVQVKTGPCRLTLTSSSVASSPAAMVQKLVGYSP